MGSALESWLERVLAPTLKSLLDPWHTFLNGLPPWTWRLAVCAYLLLGCLWVVGLKKTSIYAGAPSQSRWRDLRWWVALVLLPYLLVYLTF